MDGPAGFNQKKRRQEPPCGGLMSCFPWKSRAPVLELPLAGHCHTPVQAVFASGAPAPSTAWSSWQGAWAGKELQNLPQMTESREGREQELFWWRRMALGHSGPLGTPSPRVRTTQSSLKFQGGWTQLVFVAFHLVQPS